jgi:putative transposase
LKSRATVAKPAYAGLLEENAMRGPYTQLYLHLVWATWDRLPLITEAVESRLYAAIAQKCRDLKCVPLSIGGIADHVHLLVRLHATVDVSTLVKEVKGSSSHLVSHEITPEEFFRWQGAYGAFTLRKEDVPRVKAYVEGQKEHHAVGNVWEEWEQTTIPSEE